MIPKFESKIDNTELNKETSKTFRIDFKNQKAMGFTDNIEAIKQAIYLILHTERYKSPIHSWNYGIELQSLFGKPTSYVLPELKRRIKEALTQDDRILDVDAFNFDIKKNKVHAEFIVHTVFGDIETEREVII